MVVHFHQRVQDTGERCKQTMKIVVLLVHAENLSEGFGKFKLIWFMRFTFLSLYLFWLRLYVVNKAVNLEWYVRWILPCRSNWISVKNTARSKGCFRAIFALRSHLWICTASSGVQPCRNAVTIASFSFQQTVRAKSEGIFPCVKRILRFKSGWGAYWYVFEVFSANLSTFSCLYVPSC